MGFQVSSTKKPRNLKILGSIISHSPTLWQLIPVSCHGPVRKVVRELYIAYSFLNFLLIHFFLIFYFLGVLGWLDGDPGCVYHYQPRYQ